MKRILCVVGTRPEAIKMAPLINALRQHPEFCVRVLATAQHRELLDQVFELFEIEADIDLDIMQPGQTLPALTARLTTSLDKCFEEENPDLVIAQGDTTTVFVAALASFYRKIPFAHLEAGLRTGDMYSPFPEEGNRVLAGRLACLHFAPTEQSRQNLLKEGINDSDIYVTGNTVIDSLLQMSERDVDLGVDLPADKKLVLLTSHRRENFGQPFQNICEAVRRLVEANEDIVVLFPVHPNPNIRETVQRELRDIDRIILVDPLDYAPFVKAISDSHLILTDSGGVQEEAPALAKPVLVLRRDTERPEAAEAGVVKLIGTEVDDIFNEANRLLNDVDAYNAMAIGVSPYGDGKASQRIVGIVEEFFGIKG